MSHAFALIRFNWCGNCSVNAFRRLHGQVVGVLDLKSGDPEFKSHLDYQLGLFQAVSLQLLGCVCTHTTGLPPPAPPPPAGILN